MPPLDSQLLVVINRSRTELPFRFDVVSTELIVEGYQLYAVEKWLVDRDRPVVTLTVYTGDPAHKVRLSMLLAISILLIWLRVR